MKIFRITLEVSNLDQAAAFYAKLLDTEGKRHPGGRHYFDCGGVILAVLDPTQGGMPPTSNPKSLYFAVDDIAAVHAGCPCTLYGASAFRLTARARTVQG